MRQISTNKVTGYREPWQAGAKAYPQADTIEALLEGTKRKRKGFIVHLAHSGFGHLPCASCGIPVGDPYPVNEGDKELRTDTWATGRYNPTSKRLVPLHYYCSWGVLIRESAVPTGKHGILI